MNQLSVMIEQSVSQLEVRLTTIIDPSVKRYWIVALGCAILELFLRIHPYANGNGHIARYCLTAILGRFGCWLTTFHIEPKPNNPQQYAMLLMAYRRGNRLPLERFILQCLQ